MNMREKRSKINIYKRYTYWAFNKQKKKKKKEREMEERKKGDRKSSKRERASKISHNEILFVYDYKYL